MRTFAHQQSQPQKPVSSSLVRPNKATSGQNHHSHPILHLQRTIGNQAVHRLLQTHAEEFNAGLTGKELPLFGHNFSLIPLHSPTGGAIQTKLAIDRPGDEYEQEADRVAEHVMHMPELHHTYTCSGGYHRCQKAPMGYEHERLQTSQGQANDVMGTTEPPIVHDVLNSLGQPLDINTRAFMESRFGHDFSSVRVHTDAQAAESAQAVHASAYTVGQDVIFGAGRYAPDTAAGRGLIAHELTHTIQQNHAMSTTGMKLSARTNGLLLQRQSLSISLGGIDDEGALLWESFRHSITLDNFDHDKAMLKPEHFSKLKEFKEGFQMLLGRYPDSFISVIGHTDATGTEKHNKGLGQKRADAVKSELTSGESALPVEIIYVGSLGESMLAVETKGSEARNRRVEIIPRLRHFLELPLPKPSQPLPGLSSVKPGKSKIPGIGPGPFTLGVPTKIPNLTITEKNWLEEALKNDPIIKKLLAGWMRDSVIDALKDGDEMLAEKIIDALPLDDKTKTAIQAVAKSLLQMAKGKKFKVPEPPSRQSDFGPKPEFPKMPGEVIIPGPTIRF